MHSVLETLISMGAKLRPPADEEGVARIANQLGISLPQEAHSLYVEANGSDGEFGEWSWNFWGIDSEEVTLGSYLKKPREYVVSPGDRKIDPNKYIRFFDCLINLPLYAYCADSESPNFGEVIGCHTDDGEFDAFISAKNIPDFLSMLAETHGDEIILIDEG